MDLNIDADELNACVQCGLCLTACPTYRVTGDETMSPRGRIALMRQVQDDDVELGPDILHAFSTCVQCRGCEPACPSGVPYGRLMEQTRETLADARIMTPQWQRAMLKPLAYPQMLRIGTKALGIAQRLRIVPAALDIGETVPLRSVELRSSGTDVILFTGCVMDAWQREVHRSAQRVIESLGLGVQISGDAVPCCGALHTHAGLGRDARALAEHVIETLSISEAPILVDSAGCGAALKEYGSHLGTAEAQAFSERVFDICEWLAPRLSALADTEPLPLRVAVQDPCHLRHVQRVHGDTRVALTPFVRELVELDDDGMCCGAGGAYSLVEPDLAGQIRDRKIGFIELADADVIASANPGCSMHLAGAGATMAHPIELIDAALHPDGDHRDVIAALLARR